MAGKPPGIGAAGGTRGAGSLGSPPTDPKILARQLQSITTSEKIRSENIIIITDALNKINDIKHTKISGKSLGFGPDYESKVKKVLENLKDNLSINNRQLTPKDKEEQDKVMLKLGLHVINKIVKETGQDRGKIEKANDQCQNLLTDIRLCLHNKDSKTAITSYCKTSLDNLRSGTVDLNAAFLKSDANLKLEKIKNEFRSNIFDKIDAFGVEDQKKESFKNDIMSLMDEVDTEIKLEQLKKLSDEVEAVSFMQKLEDLNSKK